MHHITDRLAVMALGIIIILYGLVSPARALTSLADSMKKRGYYE
jgi:hypothetical protein